MRELMERLEAAMAEYDRKMAVPIVGLFYSMPAWRRYVRAFDAYRTAEAEYFRSASSPSVRGTETR
jgi:bisphosphoglycerate-independent phosphoglycerate mutase (AlkP superfamily)